MNNHQKNAETFGKRLKKAVGVIAHELEKNKSYVRDELGDAIGRGSGKHTIEYWERGHIPATSTEVLKLAEHLVEMGGITQRHDLEAFIASSGYDFDSIGLGDYPFHTLKDFLDSILPQDHPDSVAQPQPDIPNNIPIPPYGYFIPRKDAYAKVIRGLKQEATVVLVVGMGGIGKTSLIYKIAQACRDRDKGMPKFDAIVWVSDKDQPSTTTWDRVLDEIAYTLESPGYTHLDRAAKQRNVEKLLRNQRVLVVVDNMETVTDEDLIQHVVRLPGKGKVILTSREDAWGTHYNNIYLAKLSGMDKNEALAFIEQFLQQRDIKAIASEEKERLYTVTGGNPRAMQMIASYLDHSGSAFEDIVQDLPTEQETLFDDLYSRYWASLAKDTHAQHMLLSMVLFPSSVNREALAQTAGVYGITFKNTVKTLKNISLLETEDTDTEKTQRFTLHPLTRAFLQTKLAQHANFEQEGLRRRLQWYATFAEILDHFAWNDPERLHLIEPEEESLYHVIKWAATNGYASEVVKLVKATEYYYYVRALWNKKLELHRCAIDAAHALGMVEEEIHALALHVQLLSRQGNLDEAGRYLPRLQSLAQTQQHLSGDLFFYYHHTIALNAMARDDFQTAQQAWQHILDSAEAYSLVHHMITGTLYWKGMCLYRLGQFDAASACHCESLAMAEQDGDARFVGRNQLGLALIAIAQNNNQEATKALEEARKKTPHDDWEQTARMYWVSAKRALLHKDPTSAHTMLRRTVDLFERMGRQKEAQEAHEELAKLYISKTR